MAGAVPRLVELCKSGPLAVRLPGIRAISSMMSGSDEATQHVLDHGILEMLPAVLQSAKMQTRRRRAGRCPTWRRGRLPSSTC